MGKLALEGETDKEAVERLLAAIKTVNAMVAPQLFDAKAHGSAIAIRLEDTGLREQAAEPRQRAGGRRSWLSPQPC